MGGVEIKLPLVASVVFPQGHHGLGLVVDDDDAACVAVAKKQIGDTYKAIAAQDDFKALLNAQSLIVLAKTIEGLEVAQPLLVILARKPARKGWKVVADRFVITGCIGVREFKGHLFAAAPLFQKAVAEGAVFRIGVLFLRKSIQILEAERQRTLIVELLLGKRPFHVAGKADAHRLSPFRRAVRSRRGARRIQAYCPHGWRVWGRPPCSSRCGFGRPYRPGKFCGCRGSSSIR